MSGAKNHRARQHGSGSRGKGNPAAPKAAVRQEGGRGERLLAWIKHYGPYLFLALVLFLVALVRLRLAPIPLERDEGEYAYTAQLILQGIPPYELAANFKFPGIYYISALILALFGQTSAGLHIGLMMVHLATCVLLFFLIRRFFGAFPAAIGAAGFTMLGLDRGIMGIFAHATHFVLLPAIAGLLVLLRAMDSRRLGGVFGAGILLGLAPLMKQHGASFVLLGGFLVLWDEWQRRPATWQQLLRETLKRGSVLGLGSLIPLLVVSAVLAAQGVFDRFWFWTFEIAAAHVSSAPGPRAWTRLLIGLNTVSQANLWLWILGGIGLLILWIGRWPIRAKVFVSAFAFFSFLAMVPGFYFRPHYFILVLPAVAFGIAVAVASIDQELQRFVPGVLARSVSAAVFLAAAGAYVVKENVYLTSMSPRDVSRHRYGANPFIEAEEIARYIKEHTTEEERIAVLGSEPEIYFYANRKSVTSYIHTYALMGRTQVAKTMQDEMMDEIENGRPSYLVIVDIQASWLARPTSDPRIMNWMTRYWDACYRVVGVADIVSSDKTIYRWDEEAVDYEPKSEFILYTLKRLDPGPCRAPRD